MVTGDVIQSPIRNVWSGTRRRGAAIIASSSVRATADAHSGKGVDAVPTGGLIEITDDLVEKERAERSKRCLTKSRNCSRSQRHTR